MKKSSTQNRKTVKPVRVAVSACLAVILIIVSAVFYNCNAEDDLTITEPAEVMQYTNIIDLLKANYAMMYELNETLNEVQVGNEPLVDPSTRKQEVDGLPQENVVIAEMPAEEPIPEPVVINTTDITSPSNLSADQFNTIIEQVLSSKGKSSSKLYNAGEALYQMEQNHQINGLFALSVASLESGWGTSSAAKNKNNLFGIMSKGGIKSFSSVNENIDYFGNLISDYYISKGRTTITSIGAKYCVGGDWANKVQSMLNTYTSAANHI